MDIADTAKSTEQAAPEVQSLLAPWDGPFGGVPPWDRVSPAALSAAVDAAMTEAEAEIDAIADNPEPPTVANTVVAMESAGRSLDRLLSIYFVHTSNLNIGVMPDVQRQVAPRLAAYGDRIMQKQALFDRIAAVSRQVETAPNGEIDEATRRLVDDRYKQFVRNGAALDDEGKTRLAEINQRLASLFTEFSQNVLRDENEQVTWVEDEAQLVGLSASTVEAMAAAAADRDRPNAWAVLNTRSMMEPVLSEGADRALREQVWTTYYSRGDLPGDGDNKPIVTEILALRAERAELLGYQTHAHWRLEAAMAGTPEAAMDLMLAVWPKARARAAEEVSAMQAIADAEGADITIEPWDHRYYTQKVRKQSYDLDVNDLTPYLQMEKLIEAMLWCSGELYGLQYTPIEETEAGSVPVFHPDVRVWEVTDADGGHVGLWYLDPYAREGKLSGAWMTAYRSQENIDQPVTTLVSNNSNFVKGSADKPVLVSWDDARTLFHEFGHALHGLLSKVRYPSQSGTSVSRDYVEFPSQVNEHWLMTDEVLNRFCLHHETGRPIPAELVQRLRAAETFNQGFDTVEYLAAALMDMKLHLAGSDPIDPAAFERDTLDELGMPTEIVMRHRIPQFAHVFSGDGYSAGYYSYLWADALTADAAEAFVEGDGYFDTDVAARLHDHVLSVGDTVDPADGFRAFRGRDVDTDALLRKRGFPVGA
jgi:peptidyl-dipeptidase Dcp